MTEKEKETIWIGAFRYYCGRMTIQVSFFCDTLIKEWDKLPKRAKSVIKRDLDESFVSDDEDRARGANYYRLGHDCDRQSWEKVRALWKKEEC
jgi:hypothetical protein